MYCHRQSTCAADALEEDTVFMRRCLPEVTPPKHPHKTGLQQCSAQKSTVMLIFILEADSLSPHVLSVVKVSHGTGLKVKHIKMTVVA